jgi:PAS domain S-box-containing protein
VDLEAVLKEAILSTVADAIVAADREGKIFYWNPGAERIFGYAKSEALGRSLDIIIPPRLRERHWDGYHRMMQGGTSHYGPGDVLAVPGVTKEGRQISLEFTILPLRANTGELVGLAAIMRDVSRRFEEVRSLKQRLKDFAVKTP